MSFTLRSIAVSTVPMRTRMPFRYGIAKLEALPHVFVKVELESAPDGRVALQLLGYLSVLWQRLDRSANGQGKLPAVIPLIVYHGKPAWTLPTNFLGMVDAPPEVRKHLLDFSFGGLDLGPTPDAELSQDRELRAGLMAMKYARVRRLSRSQYAAFE